MRSCFPLNIIDLVNKDYVIYLQIVAQIYLKTGYFLIIHLLFLPVLCMDPENPKIHCTLLFFSGFTYSLIWMEEHSIMKMICE